MIFICVLILILLIMLSSSNRNRLVIDPFVAPPLLKPVTPTVTFPFKNTRDEHGNLLPVIMLSAPFRSKNDEDRYQVYRDMGLQFCGISSYLDFPNPIHNPHEDQYHITQRHSYPDITQAWLHCFRKPGYTEPFRHLPHALITEADLKPTPAFKPEPKKYDFLYCCLDDNDQCDPGWQSYNRNWDLAKKCLEVMCGMSMRGVIIGRKHCEFTRKCDGIVSVQPFLPHEEFLKVLQTCRFLFVPNVSDASPRVITDALVMNVPALVNDQILGGWHNVIPGVTGEFFSSEHDISHAIRRIQKGGYRPRDWFQENRDGHSRRYLADFLSQHFMLEQRPLEVTIG